MAKWLSSCVKKQPEVKHALSELTDIIREYNDAAKPSACRGEKTKLWNYGLDWFRPNWKIFSVIMIGCGIGGAVFARFVSGCSMELFHNWADLALKITIPVFTIGISLVALARSIGEGNKFIGEYLNESCRTATFCHMALIATLCGTVGYLTSTIEKMPILAVAGICAASLGVAVESLITLAFVMCEAIRCFAESKSITVVSQYVARKLTCGYLKESYTALLSEKHTAYIEEWCKEAAIHPPSQSYSMYFKQHSNKDIMDVTLNSQPSEPNVYKDYNLKCLEKLNNFLKENGAELYLNSPLDNNEYKSFGHLICENIQQNQQILSGAQTLANKALIWKRYELSAESSDFWDSQESKLNEAMKRAVGSADPIQVFSYLKAINIPLSNSRQIRKKHRVIRDAVGECPRREWQFLRLYLKALHELLKTEDTDAINELAHRVRNSLWDEVKDISQNMDHHAMKMYTWLAQEMYTMIWDEGEKKEILRKMRAQFGGFYKFASGWLEDAESKGVNTDEMRLVLHEGLTKWLKLAIQKKDTELVEQLCDAGRGIVFKGDTIKFNHVDVGRQHFLLGGWLIGLAKSNQVNHTAIERLFCKQYSHQIDVDFDELVNFYISTPSSPETMENYKRIFSSTTETRRDFFSDSYSSSGWGMMGYREMARVFVFLATHALKKISLPGPNINMAERVTKEDINIVKDVFKGQFNDIGKVEKWIQCCDTAQNDKEAKEIADALLDKAKVKEHEVKFWEGYSRSVPVLSLCLKNGNYKIEKDINSQWRYLVPKIALFDWKYPIIGADGDEYGTSIGHQMENNILVMIDKDSKEETEVKGNIAEVIGQAVRWLEQNGCPKGGGFVIVKSDQMFESKLYKDKDYIPAWREEMKSTGFDGFYRGYPIVHFRDSEEGKEEKQITEKSELDYQKVIGVDLRGWTGLRVRKEVVSDTARKYGELKIRTWTDEEIKQAVDANKLDKKDVDKAKGNCPVDITFYWEVVAGKLPKTKSFKFDASETASNT